ncbi:hypothetical protein X801_09092 [Opisthorchis viverrini]|uniref:Uncharacterized protein n=1 Tax=Opisthorchis viverrini TaxID=6198 RepID=A0A1S8WKZ9_OPIVI|nr:hypothetical protein X801_09092 [Opisthorchis viverrini]
MSSSMTVPVTLAISDTVPFSSIAFRIFLWAAVSNISVHVIALLVAFHNLKLHKTFRICVPLLILGMGVLNTVTVMLVSSLVIAGVYKATGISFNDVHAIVMGLLQTSLAFIFSVSRVLAML